MFVRFRANVRRGNRVEFVEMEEVKRHPYQFDCCRASPSRVRCVFIARYDGHDEFLYNFTHTPVEVPAGCPLRLIGEIIDAEIRNIGQFVRGPYARCPYNTNKI